MSLTPELAVLSTRLPGDFHGDPADRLIVASSLSLNAPLITCDKKSPTGDLLRFIGNRDSILCQHLTATLLSATP